MKNKKFYEPDEIIRLGNNEINIYLEREVLLPHYSPCIVRTNGRYHVSWDWLMEVVEKINKEQQAKDAIRDLNYTITYLLAKGYGYTDFERLRTTFTLKNLWRRVVLYCQYKNNGDKPVTTEEVYVTKL
jgi:hypothetical protein